MLEIQFHDAFQEFAALLLLSALVGLIATRLRQPLIVAFIAVGILVGPSLLGWVHESMAVDLLAEIGIALLLFVVGLKLDLHLIRTMGPVALAAHNQLDANQLVAANADLVLMPFADAAERLVLTLDERMTSKRAS
ncbi:MAG: cation:proton antiporter [Xanthomonadaceae bacterium]|nr:cation:proton antiporter [Xanthomonadaceae bacterium]